MGHWPLDSDQPREVRSIPVPQKGDKPEQNRLASSHHWVWIRGTKPSTFSNEKKKKIVAEKREGRREISSDCSSPFKKFLADPDTRESPENRDEDTKSGKPELERPEGA